MKKVMMLGGNYFQATATKAAKELGYYVISVDYLPENPAHKYADEYYNISTTDKEAVLRLAEKLQIDGIVSYASDVGAPTVSYVSEKMGLPGNPYDSVRILTEKDRFRKFLEEHGFRVPKGKGFTDKKKAREFCESISMPVMVKPVDSSGSKGVSQIYSLEELDGAFDSAMEYSRTKRIIIEEFLKRDGYQIAGDGFIIEGELVFTGFMNEHFDHLCNPFVPIGESYPSILKEEYKQKAKNEIQRVLTLLNMKRGAINLDFMVNKEGEVCILEIGPRNGGNLITDALKIATGADLAKGTIAAAIEKDTAYCSYLEKKTEKLISSYIVHAQEEGIYQGIEWSKELEQDIIQSDIWTKKGEHVKRFDNGSFGMGAMLIKHKSIQEMLERMDHMEDYMKVKIEN